MEVVAEGQEAQDGMLPEGEQEGPCQHWLDRACGRLGCLQGAS
jgi:hypothetical protein